MNRKALFDAVRRLLGRRFTSAEVTAIDRAIDEGLRGDDGPRAQKDPTEITLQVSPRGLALIKRFEGCAKLRSDGLVAAYPDPGTGAAPWTIGWGATGPDIGPDTVWTQQQCDERLARDVERHAADVRRAIGLAPTTQNQFDALVSFHYNTGAIARATLTRLHNAGKNAAAAGEFARWINAGGRPMRGLARRRAEEASLYRSAI